MIPLVNGDDYMFALLAVRTRRAAFELIIKEHCQATPSLTRCYFQFLQAFKLQPDVVVLDTELALQLRAHIAYHRLNGDILALYAESDKSTAWIKVIDLDGQITGEWQYKTRLEAWSALHRWMLDREDAPAGYIGASQRTAKSSPRFGGLLSGTDDDGPSS